MKLNMKFKLYFGLCLTMFVVFSIFLFINVYFLLKLSKPPEVYNKSNNDQFAFVTSSYFFPESKSLGSNALALILTMNLLQTQGEASGMEFLERFKTDKLVIFAENATSSITVETELQQVTFHATCRMVVVAANVELIPNVREISMVSRETKTLIPFTTPNHKKRDVVFCISPLFVSEHWQNFLFAVHIYKHFGAHTHLYAASVVTPFYNLIREYEKDDYVTLQPWTSINFPGVRRRELDWAREVEFRNQAASQSDCLLQYKESASFVGFVDFDDILIPKIAPTYIQEFQHFMNLNSSNLYLFYDKENYNAKAVTEGSNFSFIGMLNSLEYQSFLETGKMIIPPDNLNATWIHWPAKIPKGTKKFHVKDNSITHLKHINLDIETMTNLTMSNNTILWDMLISIKDAETIEKDLHKMLQKIPIQGILKSLPKDHFYGNLVGECYDKKFYRFHYSKQFHKIKCPGTHLCKYEQRPDIKCMHANATIHIMPRLQPITFYYAKDPYFTEDIGCYP